MLLSIGEEDIAMWFVYAILAAIITGIGQVLVKKGQVNLTPLFDNFLAAIIVNIILVPLLFIRGVDLSSGPQVIIYALIAATMYATFYYIISLGTVSIMISLINTFPVVTIVLAMFYLNDLPSRNQWVGIFFVIVGLIFMSQEGKNNRQEKTGNLRIIWGLFGALAIGIAEFVTKLATMKTDGFTFTFFVYLMYLPPIFIFSLFDKKGRKSEMFKNKPSLQYTILGILLIELGLIAIALAYQYGLASLVSPVVATQILVTAVLAAIFIKERLLPIQKIGILINIIGVSIIGIWS